MKNSNYKELFEQVKGFKEEQEKQKQRGLNNYNILTTVLKEHDEVRLHSRMIASFLDPSGEHYQSTLFLDKFLEILNVSNFKIDSKNCSVYREYKNIDLYITDGHKHIILENKVYAKDQPKQIKRYVDEITNKENKNLKLNDVLVIYLSLDRIEPSSDSLDDLSIENGIVKEKEGREDIALFKSIHYKNEILDWLEKCKYEVQNITNLNEVFRQYIDVVKMINNQYEDKIMSLADYIKDNKEIYKLAIEIEKELPKARDKIVNDFFEEIIPLLENKLGNEWIVEVVGNLSKQWKCPFRVYKRNWINRENKNLIFAFEFDKNNYYTAYWGIVRKNEKVNIKEDIVTTFESRLNSLNCKKRTTQWWLHLESVSDDFCEYIQFNKNAKENFIYGIMKLIKIFELDTNLITEINSYLNEKDKN